jgi:D-glucuronyl C5-epimerase-like protein
MAIRRSWRCLTVALVALLAAAASAQAAPILVLGQDGRVRVHRDALGPQPPLRAAGAVGPAPRALAARRKTVIGELKRLLAAGAIDAPTYQARRASYEDAKRVVRKLSGRRALELGAVVSTLDGIAARGSLTASRMDALWMTLERNRQWWTTAPLPASGQRVGFQGSELVWQYYPGQGLQLQALANFGKLNGLWEGKIYDDRLAHLLDELLALGVDRAGGTAWEYYFTFDGGRPPWVSSLAQGTALQALARAAIRLGRQVEVWPVANAGLAIFKAPPPAGVRVPSVTGSGTHYLQYSFDRHLYILNGFVQSLNGLADYAKLANDPEAQTLFQEGVAAARAEVPEFDTGAWSLYSRGDSTHESDLSYHKLLRDFMRGLCDRTQDPVFCGAEQHYDAYLVQKPQLQLTTTRVRGGTTGALKFSLSKISRIGVRVTRADGAPVLVRQVGVLGYGKRTIAWRVPRHKGIYTVTLTAVDLAGNAQSIAGPVEVLKPKRTKR